MGPRIFIKRVSGAGLGVSRASSQPRGSRHNCLHHLGEERRPGLSHHLPKVTRPTSKWQNQGLSPRLCGSTFHVQPPQPVASCAALSFHLPRFPSQVTGDPGPASAASGRQGEPEHSASRPTGGSGGEQQVAGGHQAAGKPLHCSRVLSDLGLIFQIWHHTRDTSLLPPHPLQPVTVNRWADPSLGSK